MFYPKSPCCDAKSESIEPDTYEVGTRRMGQYLHSQSLQGHAHPLLKAAQIVMIAGRQVYKRMPGGGEKRCTSCGRTFR